VSFLPRASSLHLLTTTYPALPTSLPLCISHPALFIIFARA
jgi:hypothetical protein